MKRRLHSLQLSRGTTLLEVFISTFIMMLLGLIVIPATISFSQAIKAQRFQQIMQQQAALAIQLIDDTMISATVVTLSSLTDTELVLTLPKNSYQETQGQTTYIQRIQRITFRFVDGDGNPSTIEDNRIVMISEEMSLAGAIISSYERTILTHVTPFFKQDGGPGPIFVFRPTGTTGAHRDHVEFVCRIGDRNNPDNRRDDPVAKADDRITGVGYQGFTFRCILTPNNSRL